MHTKAEILIGLISLSLHGSNMPIRLLKLFPMPPRPNDGRM
jgi:hypothetical protein